MEIKTKTGKLNKLQRILHKKWKRYFHVVRSVEEALAVIGVRA